MQTIAPVLWHCVVHWLDRLVRHWAKLLSWHFSWQLAFAVPVHEPVQSALHFVMQSALVATLVHCVSQWSSQQALHEAEQSVVDVVVVDPSGESLAVLAVVHEPLQPDSQRDEQSVVQSKLELDAHIVEQLDWQLDWQLASADAVHWESHCSSSCAAQACSHCGGAHCVAQSFCRTREQLALEATSMLPQAAIPALATDGQATIAPVKELPTMTICARLRVRERFGFMDRPSCNARTNAKN